MTTRHKIPHDIGLPADISWHLTGHGGFRADIGIKPSTDIAWFREEPSTDDWATLRDHLTRERHDRLRMPVLDDVWHDGTTLYLYGFHRLWAAPVAWIDVLTGVDGYELAVQNETEESPALAVLRRRVKRPGVVPDGSVPWRFEVGGFVGLRGVSVASVSDAGPKN
jgi:hypothetical protein